MANSKAVFHDVEMVTDCLFLNPKNINLYLNTSLSYSNSRKRTHVAIREHSSQRHSRIPSSSLSKIGGTDSLVADTAFTWRWISIELAEVL